MFFSVNLCDIDLWLSVKEYITQRNTEKSRRGTEGFSMMLCKLYFLVFLIREIMLFRKVRQQPWFFSANLCDIALWLSVKEYITRRNTEKARSRTEGFSMMLCKLYFLVFPIRETMLFRKVRQQPGFFSVNLRDIALWLSVKEYITRRNTEKAQRAFP